MILPQNSDLPTERCQVRVPVRIFGTDAKGVYGGPLAARVGKRQGLIIVDEKVFEFHVGLQIRVGDQDAVFFLFQ